METVLFKYESLGSDYLICDTARTALKLSPRVIRSICARNFGVGSMGLVAGSLTDSNRVELRLYSPDGSETQPDERAASVFASYLTDAGYLKNGRTPSVPAEQVGKIFLSDRFLG